MRQIRLLVGALQYSLGAVREVEIRGDVESALESRSGLSLPAGGRELAGLHRVEEG